MRPPGPTRVGRQRLKQAERPMDSGIPRRQRRSHGSRGREPFLRWAPVRLWPVRAPTALAADYHLTARSFAAAHLPRDRRPLRGQATRPPRLSSYYRGLLASDGGRPARPDARAGRRKACISPLAAVRLRLLECTITGVMSSPRIWASPAAPPRGRLCRTKKIRRAGFRFVHRFR
jgi:hypothetical protein